MKRNSVWVVEGKLTHKDNWTPIFVRIAKEDAMNLRSFMRGIMPKAKYRVRPYYPKSEG